MARELEMSRLDFGTLSIRPLPVIPKTLSPIGSPDLSGLTRAWEVRDDAGFLIATVYHESLASMITDMIAMEKEMAGARA